MHNITTIDAHTAGEPLRIITGGFPEPLGETILQKRNYARKNLDHLRRLLMLEPRGHADMYGCIVVAPERADSALGVLFLHNEGYSTMCGHGIIAMVTIGLEHGMWNLDDNGGDIRVDTPAGQVQATANWDNNRVASVTFNNVPSFVLLDRKKITLDSYGEIELTIAFGGAFYAYVNAEELGLNLIPDSYNRIVDAGKQIKQAVIKQLEITHPCGSDDINFLYGVIFVAPPENPIHHSRNVCVFAEGEVDRSPTGTGVSGRAAIECHHGKLKMGQSITIESILGTTFDVEVAAHCEVAGVAGIIPRVTGSAFMTGRHEFVLDDRDELIDGFLLR